MKHKKICIVLTYLDLNTLKEFKSLSATSFFNKNILLTNFISILCKFYPEFNSRKFTEGFVINSLAKVSKNKVPLDKLFTEAYQLFEKFIAIKEMDDFQPDLSLLNFLKEKRLGKLFETKAKKAKKKLENISFKDKSVYNFNHELEYLIFQNKLASNEKGIGDSNLAKLNFAIDEAFIYQKIRTACFTMNRMNMYAFNYDIKFIEEIVAHLDSESGKDYNIVIYIWLKVYNLLKQEASVEDYYSLKETFFTNLDKIVKNDVKAISHILKNVCNKILRASPNFYKERFELQSILFEYQDPKIDLLLPSDYLNFINLGLADSVNADKAYIFNFIESKKDKLYPEYQEKEGIYELGMAHYLFACEKHEEALDFINLVNCINIHRKQMERRLRGILYFELGEIELLRNHLKSYRKFLSVNKSDLTEVHLEANRQFTNIFLKLINHKVGKTGKASLLKEEIIGIDILPNKNWFLKKVSQTKS